MKFDTAEYSAARWVDPASVIQDASYHTALRRSHLQLLLLLKTRQVVPIFNLTPICMPLAPEPLMLFHIQILFWLKRELSNICESSTAFSPMGMHVAPQDAT